MTWKEALMEKVEEEAADKAEYMRLSEMAEADECFHEARILRDIAQEESIHKKLISEMVHHK